VDGKYYYGFFLRIYEMIDLTHPIYQSIKEISNTEIKLFSPKYLSFISMNPFFVSFKNLLEEIYIQSTINDTKCFKFENILSVLLYRIYLPKYETTQLSFALNDKLYNFSRTPFQSEISIKLLFCYLTIEKIVLLFVAFLMNSIIVFFHSK
jgi:hypothetical protein